MELKIARHNIFFVLLLFVCLMSNGQSALEKYVTYGLKSNLSLQQKEMNYEKSTYALSEAKGMFFPNISVEARYSLAEGGRTIDMPIRDLFQGFADYNNFVNNTSLSVPGPIQNVAFPFLRDKEHETKLRMVQPVFNADIYYNYKIKQDLLEVDRIDVQVFKRYLVKEIKQAYFNYLKALALQKLVEESMELVNENIRVNKSLFKNDKITIDNVYQAEAELSKVLKKQAGATKYANTARAYFNFLMNKPYDTPIEVDSLYARPPGRMMLDTNLNYAVTNREEITMLEKNINVSNRVLGMNKSNRLPDVLAVVDYGYQGTEYSFTGEDDYLMASFLLSWDIFKGMQNKNKIQQAKIDEIIARQKLQETREQIKLQVISAYFELEEASKAHEAALAEHKSSSKAFGIVEKRYRAGQTGYLEYTNARTQTEMAAENKIITQYDIYISQAGLEQATGTYVF